MDKKKLTRKQMIQLGLGAVIFIGGFYCGCKFKGAFVRVYRF